MWRSVGTFLTRSDMRTAALFQLWWLYSSLNLFHVSVLMCVTSHDVYVWVDTPRCSLLLISYDGEMPGILDPLDLKADRVRGVQKEAGGFHFRLRLLSSSSPSLLRGAESHNRNHSSAFSDTSNTNLLAPGCPVRAPGLHPPMADANT